MKRTIYLRSTLSSINSSINSGTCMYKYVLKYRTVIINMYKEVKFIQNKIPEDYEFICEICLRKEKHNNNYVVNVPFLCKFWYSSLTIFTIKKN